MISLLLLLGAMVLVLGGILVLRLHAFLALVFASLVIATLTPPSLIQGYHLSSQGGIMSVDESGQLTARPAKWLASDSEVVVLQRSGELSPWVQSGTAKIIDGQLDPASLTMNDGFTQGNESCLFPADRWKDVESASGQSVGNRLASGFGSTAGKIGILIALASVIGSCLMSSGAASRIIHSLITLFGEKRASLGFVIGSFIVGIPVFFDTVFYLMIPLAREFYRKQGKGYLLCVLSIVAGATMAHSLVPPTPGPMQVASELGVPIGLMMMAGLGMGIVTVSSGYLMARWMEKRVPVTLPEIPPTSEESSDTATSPGDQPGPSLWLSLMPIILPVLLISAGTVVDMGARTGALSLPQALVDAIAFVANKNIALALAALVALMLAWKYTDGGRKAVSGNIQSALMSGGVILLITAAGGGFGQVLKETGITLWAGRLSPGGTPWAVLLAFGVTSLIRIAQGSATVAMVTAVGVVQPLVASGELGFHPVYLALAIGCGSKPIPWMNDSGFWIISRMGGFTEKDTLKTASVMMTTMGVVGGIVTFLLAWIIG